MARSTNGPRQPLSQRKPQVAARHASAAKQLAAKPTLATPKVATRKVAAPKVATPKGAKPRPGKSPSAVAAKKRGAPDPAVIFARLHAEYPDAHCELDFTSPYQLLVATILSAQCTDKRVNMVTPVLFATYPNPAALAAARPEDVEEIIKSTGFFRAKTKSIIGMANAVVERHGGQIPRDMEALTSLPGVGRKTANVLLGNAYDINVGVVVDTHVARLSHRLALSAQDDPVKIEQDLMQKFPSDEWTLLSHLLIWHGRRICEAKRPQCSACVLADICPSAFREPGSR